MSTKMKLGDKRILVPKISMELLEIELERGIDFNDVGNL